MLDINYDETFSSIVRFVLICDYCEFVSEKYKLYFKIPPNSLNY